MRNDPFPTSIFGNKTFTVQVGVTLTIVALIAGGILVYFHQTYPNLRASITFGASLFVASVGIASILVTAENLRRGIHERRSVSAARFIERWNDPKSWILKTSGGQFLRK